MKLNIYTIYDTAAAVYLRPFFMQSDGQAMRSFTDIATDANHDVGKHPEDYSLIRLGIYDDNSGTLHNENNECLATGLEVVAHSRNIDRNQLKLIDDELKVGGTD